MKKRWDWSHRASSSPSTYNHLRAGSSVTGRIGGQDGIDGGTARRHDDGPVRPNGTYARLDVYRGCMDTLQLKVVEPPGEMLFGETLNKLITGRPGPVGVMGATGVPEPETITCVVAVALPPALEAVKV